MMGRKQNLVKKVLGVVKEDMRRVKRWWLRHDREHRTLWRVGNAAAALLILTSVLIPVIEHYVINARYKLSSETIDLVGANNQALAGKLKYNSETKTYEFNKEAVKEFNPADALKKQMGGADEKTKSLYALDVPEDPTKGVTYHDINSQLSFKMVPQFKSLPGKVEQGRLVFPLDGGPQAVYTLKNNGLKEDIVVSDNRQDTLRFSYNLELPKSLEARMIPGGKGAVGIYSGDPTLFSNISYGSDKDREMVEKAREKAEKNYLVFGIPAPVITKSDSDKNTTSSARFELKNNQLTVVAEHLSDLKKPFSIDPSVIVTSTTDFETGNNEGNIDFSTANQIGRVGLTGGTVGTWASADTGTPFATPRYHHASVVYNNYLYVLGGRTSSGGDTNSVQYAPINSNGTIGTWAATNALINDRMHLGVAVYNGYIYVLGGTDASDTFYDDVQYAPLNANGTVGTWHYTHDSIDDSTTFVSGFTTARYGHAVEVYNGYIYVMAGCTNSSGECGGISNNVQYAPLNANGTVGTWGTTASMTTTRYGHRSAVYNGYLYVLGGCAAKDGLNNCASTTNSVEYAPINSNGTVGTWVAGSAFTTARRFFTAEAYNGYLYLRGGSGQLSDVQYAPINANGSIGVWRTTTAFTTGRFGLAGVAHKGHLYLTGGCTSAVVNCGSDIVNDTQYAAINAPGGTSSYSTPANYTTAGRTAFATVAYGGYIYVTGGTTDNSGGEAAMLDTTRYAPINADGSLGTWATASNVFASQTTVSGEFCFTGGNCAGRVGLAAAAYNGYLFIAGGWTNTGGGGTATHWSDVQSAAICTASAAPHASCTGAGDLAPWSTVTQNFVNGGAYSSVEGRSQLAMEIYNGRMYLIGGHNDQASSTNYDTIYYANLTTSGGAGAFTLSTTNLPSGRAGIKTFVSSGRLYIVGGGTGNDWSVVNNNVNDVQFIPIVNSDGSLDGGTGWQNANTMSGGSGSSFSAANDLQDYDVSIHNGFIYVTGGQNGTGAGNTYATVYRAQFNTSGNGSLGAWSTITAFANPRYHHSNVIHNGFLYVIGGCPNKGLGFINCNTQANNREDYEYAQINNGGGGANFTASGSPTTTTALGASRIGANAAAVNGFMYVIGGNSNTVASPTASGTVSRATINGDGTLSSWVTTDPTVTARYGASMGVHKGTIYVVSGYDGSSYLSSIQYATPNPTTGVIGSWSTVSPTGMARIGASSVAYSGYLYTSGGYDGTTINTDIKSIPINSDGSISAGSWSSAGSNFTTGRYGHRMLANDGYMYILGGCSAGVNPCTSNSALADVQFAQIGSGTITGSWTATASFNVPRYYFNAAVHNGYMYVYSGNSTSAALGDVQYAPIFNSGTLGRWKGSTLPISSTAVYWGAGAMTNGTMYLLGGSNGAGTGQTASNYAGSQTIPRVGRWSKLIDLGVRSNLREITYNGNLANGNADIRYKASLNTDWSSSASGGASVIATTRCEGVNSIRYVLVTVTIDDSSRASFPDAQGIIGNVTDVTSLYEASRSPNIRMRLGQTLQNGTLSDLDICKL